MNWLTTAGFVLFLLVAAVFVTGGAVLVAAATWSEVSFVPPREDPVRWILAGIVVVMGIAFWLLIAGFLVATKSSGF